MGQIVEMESARAERINLTARRVEEAVLPIEGESRLHDLRSPGLALRLRASGGKSWQFTYRTGGGRAGQVRRMTLGSYPALGLAEARREADRLRGLVAVGHDPVAAAKAEAEAERLRRIEEEKRLSLAEALDAYEAYLARRAVRDRRNVLSALRRRLLGDEASATEKGLGNVVLDAIARNDITRIVASLEAQGMAGAARSLRQKAATFLNWAVDEGHLAANPLAGLRRRRATRAERLEAPGRLLGDADLAAVWRAASAMERDGRHGARVLAAIVKILILTGQRRTETARMRHQDVDADTGWWTIPAAEAKNGVAHQVPLGPEARRIIESQPLHLGCPWVFSSDGRSPVSGWSKLLPKLRDAAAAEGLDGPWTLHDLRRSFRSGLTRLHVDPDLAEILINHRPEKLRSIYDREPRLAERQAAALRWEEHVMMFCAGQTGQQA